jgi:uncharacterized protein YneF (UPF0154 family)
MAESLLIDFQLQQILASLVVITSITVVLVAGVLVARRYLKNETR